MTTEQKEEEQDMGENRSKLGVEVTENIGIALGIGIVYMEMPEEYGNEYYLYINLWRWNIAVGKFNH